MTREELNFRSFENRFEYSYLCQPDGCSKSVIFSYFPRGMYDLDKEFWTPIIRFEAESLEKAFNFAFHCEDICPVRLLSRRTAFGVINEFQIDAWNTVKKPETYTTVSGVIKNLQEQLDKESKEIEDRKNNFLKWKERNEKIV